jgi:Fe-S-cluster-containing hydrogenase component 2
LRLGPSTFDDTIQRLPGLSVTISQDCTACGECHSTCPVNAIHFQDEISVIDCERCKGCGVCVVVCPEGAPQLYMDDTIDVVQRLFDRIRTRTEIGL